MCFSSFCGIIRICGDTAIEVASKIFKSVNGKNLLEVKSHTVHYGHIVDNDNIIDEIEKNGFKNINYWCNYITDIVREKKIVKK